MSDEDDVDVLLAVDHGVICTIEILEILGVCRCSDLLCDLICRLLGFCDRRRSSLLRLLVRLGR